MHHLYASLFIYFLPNESGSSLHHSCVLFCDISHIHLTIHCFIARNMSCFQMLKITATNIFMEIFSFISGISGLKEMKFLGYRKVCNFNKNFQIFPEQLYFTSIAKYDSCFTYPLPSNVFHFLPLGSLINM